MTGETELSLLLRDMQPVRCDGVFVFCIAEGSMTDFAALDPVLMFKEKEGLALILRQEIADKNDLGYSGVYTMITLNIHSSLEAVGFLAAITNALAEAGISVNPVAAHYHDHLFILQDRADDAMAVLEKLSARYV